MGEVKHLQINYKTDELFADFRENLVTRTYI